MDALRAVRGAAGRGGPGMLMPEKFQSGHMPRGATVPLSRSSLRSDDGSATLGSDMDDESSDNDEIEVCSGRDTGEELAEGPRANKDDEAKAPEAFAQEASPRGKPSPGSDDLWRADGARAKDRTFGP
ncbi:unnamed protein product [Miscanthus lutarioriparius]|uniref:Uncharacterized protein n=1 Tax=Miscanthus lutarioriparius TaxID=422564 RepID=A0A811RDL1_9POAL|nr:unnamed protein product [Miscanthus lutarioriparius]